jgi:hypothetical protein
MISGAHHRSVRCRLVGFHKTWFHCVVALLHSSPSERTPPPVAIIELFQHASWFEYGWLIGGKTATL